MQLRGVARMFFPGGWPVTGPMFAPELLACAVSYQEE